MDMSQDLLPPRGHFPGEVGQLRSFYYAAVHRSFTRAAKQLMTTQPSVSSHVKALESLVGARLFVRHARGAVLTEAGQALFELVEPLVVGIDQLQSRFAESLGNSSVQEVRLAAGHELLLHLAGPAMRDFRTVHPDIRVVASSSDRGQAQAMVASGEVDFAITSGTATPAGLEFQHVLSDELFLICPLDHKLARLDAVGIADAAPYAMLMPNPASSARSTIEAAFAQAGVELRVAMELERWHVIKEFVALDQGIAFVPGFSVAGDGARLAVRPVRGGLPPLAYGIVTRRGRHLPAGARNLIESIRTQGGSLQVRRQDPFMHP